MITQGALEEGAAILATMMAGLLSTIDATTGEDAANCKYAASDIMDNAEALIIAGDLSSLLDVFNYALAAGATVQGIDSVRTTLIALKPFYEIGTAIVVAGIQLCLYVECNVYKAISFTSRQDVEAAIVQLQHAFGPAIDYCADNSASADYQALISARAAIVTHLNDTMRPLPNMITYTVNQVMTSHRLAMHLYGDPSRADELLMENKVANPAFMPLTGYALSS